MKALVFLVILIGLTSCNVTQNIKQDGYQVGDVTLGMVQNGRDFCKPRYAIVRFLGKWVLRLIAYPVPDICPKI